MQVILINVFERACVGNSHLNREVRVGLFLSYLSVQKLISPTTYPHMATNAVTDGKTDA